VKVSRAVIFDKRGKNLYLAILSLIDAKDLRGINTLLIVRDFPHIDVAAARHRAVIGLEQPAGEKMGPR